MNESKEHVKMFKSGKLWVSALVGTLFSTALIGANATDAHADDVNTAAPTQGTVQQGSTTTANNTVALSAASTNDVTAPVSTNTSDATSATSAVASQSVSASAAAPQSAASATSTAASTGKYADGTYPLDTSKAYKKNVDPTLESTMQQFMGNTSSVTIKGNQATLSLSAMTTAKANMIASISINGVTGVRQGDNFVFTIPADQLDSLLNGHVVVSTVVPGIGQFDETQDFKVQLDTSSLLTTQQSLADSQSASASQSQAESIAASQSASVAESIAASQSIADSIANSTSAAASQSIADSTSAAASQSIANSVRASMSVADSASLSASVSQKQADEAKKGAIADGSYDTTTNYYKPGTNKVSPGMSHSLLPKVKVTVNGNQAQVIVSAASPATAKMITKISIGGVAGVLNADGQSWTFSLPTSDLSKILSGSVSISAGPYHEVQPFDVEINTADLPRVTVPDSQTPESQTPESQTPDSKTQESQSTGSQSQEASQSGQAQKPESDVKPVQPTQPESGSQAPSVSEQSGSMTGATTTPEVNGHASVSEAATSTPTASAVVSTQAKQNTPAAKTLPNTGSDQEAALTGLGVLIGTLGLGGILKKRH
ncbi:KxYKxGKxW signal peptide domain-containing protein [Weissella viridescens]|nr:KxYKxGKxW signal peptide domain-containing protein [Weissella viridescens]